MNEERHYRRKPINIILDYVDFTWTSEQMESCRIMWNNGYDLVTMANALKRTSFEVFALLYHMIEMNWIKEREGSIWGIEA